MDLNEISKRVPPPQQFSACTPAEAWTCTIQCDAGNRTPLDRHFATPGAEVCAVVHCSCQPLHVQQYPLPVTPPTGSVQDLGLPLALLVIGFEFLLK